MIIVYSNGCPKCKEVELTLKSKKEDFVKNSDMIAIAAIATRENISEMPILDIDGIIYSGTTAVNKVKEL